MHAADARGERRQFLTHNAVAAAGTWLAGIFGLVLQAMISHQFRPAEYGEVFAVFSFFTVLTQPAAGFSRLIAWATSRELSTTPDQDRESSALLRLTNRRLLIGGTLLGAAFVVAAPWLAAYLRVPALFVILGAVGVPFMFATSPLLASLQGEQRWAPWSVLSTGIALSRVVCVAGFVIAFGVAGVLLGISVAAAALYVITLAVVWPRLRRGTGPSAWRPQWRFLTLSLASTVMVAVLMGSDVILVKHFFAPRAAGQFSAVTVTSRALFFAMGSVSSVLFPKVAARHARSTSTKPVVAASLAIALIGGLLGMLVFSAGGHVILRAFSGSRYEAGAGYIGLYALGMALLAALVMLSNTQQSLADLRLLWILVPGAALKPLLILFFHQSLTVVSLMSDLSIAIILAALTVLYLNAERRPRVDVAKAQRSAARRLTPPEAVLTPSWWAAHTRWVIDRPSAVVATLAGTGLLVRHAWLTTLPLSAGDWHWPDRQRLLAYFPWPSIWDPTLGLGGENRFVGAFRYPVYWIAGALAQLGNSWTLIEKVLYFIPFAVLLPVAGWLLAREIMGRTRWTLLAPVVLLGNTYFMLESNGEVPLALGEAISFLALLAFLRTMKRRSAGWAVLTGLLLAATAAYDVRPAYLGAGVMAMYFVILAATDRDWRLLRRRALLGGLAGAVLAGSQAFWLLPLLTYHGNPGLPLPQAPNFNVLTLGHGLAGVSAAWAGGPPAQLAQAPLNPLYMILPLLAFIPLLARRMTPETLWLCLAALLCAFFTKTDNAPLGGLYDWMFVHIPGWNFFREGSKFLYIVGLAYAILIPISLRMAFEWASSRRTRAVRLWLRSAAAAGLVGVVATSCLSIVVLERGDLGSTTHPTQEPASFATLSSILEQDPRPGAVLWFGRPLINPDTHNHHFLVASPSHPAVDLTGTFNSTKINERDPFQLYCANNLVPYCYANAQLFPYLTKMTGTAYIVVPGGADAGALPPGVTRPWLRGQLASIFGTPTALGEGATQLLVWRLSSAQPAVTTSAAVALVDSGSWAAPTVLPALQALDLPAAYRQSFDKGRYPVAPAHVPDSVVIMPRYDGGCSTTTAVTVGVMAQSTSASLDLDMAGTAVRLPLLTTAARLPGWGVYGPLSLVAGNQALAPGLGEATVLGPCIAWSPLAARELAASPNSVSSTLVLSTAEQISARPGSAGPWVELRRYYDPGWRLAGQKPTALGDGLFNLYHLDTTRTASLRELRFTFSTLVWERLGEGVTAVILVGAILFAARDLRRRPIVSSGASSVAAYPSALSRWIGLTGVLVLVVTAIAATAEWFGLPSAAPWTSFASDPYDVDVGYGAAAILMLIVSLGFRIGAARPRNGSPVASDGVRLPVRVGAGAASLLVCTVALASCAGSAGSLQPLLSEAQRAGTLAPSIEGSSLTDARLQRAAGQPLLCIADYTQALGDFPDLIVAYKGRGDCYLNGGQNGPAAVHDYSQALSLAADQSDILLRRAVAYRVSGNLQAAVADYEEAAALPAARADQQLTAVDGLVAVGDDGAARAVYEHALQMNPLSGPLHLAGADIAIAAGDDTVADQELTTAQQLATSRAEQAQVLSHVCHADVIRQLEARAATDCANAAQLSNGGSGAYDDLAAAELALGNPAVALTDIDASIGAFISNAGPYSQAAGVDGFGLANLYVARGWIEVQLHRSVEALADFRRAAASLPSQAPNARARIKANIATARVD